MLSWNFLGENLHLPLPASGGSRRSMAYGNITPISVSMFTWPSDLCFCLKSPFASYKGPVIGFKTHPKSRMTPPQNPWLSNNFKEPFSKIESNLYVLEIGTWIYIFLATIQPTTPCIENSWPRSTYLPSYIQEAREWQFPLQPEWA